MLTTFIYIYIYNYIYRYAFLNKTIQLIFSPQRSNLISPEPKVAGTDLQRSKLTFVLIVAVTAAVIGSSAQFGYNTGVINNPENVRSDF